MTACSAKHCLQEFANMKILAGAQNEPNTLIPLGHYQIGDVVKSRHSRLSGIIMPRIVLKRDDSGRAGMTSKES
jgi:hypothetical protein